MAFAPEQIEALKAKLDGSVVKQREQSGRKFSYIEGWHAIAEANRIFGFDGWSRETVQTTCVWSGERKTRSGDKPAASYIARVRITVGSIVREGTGAGSGFGNDHGEAHESAIKEAETDAMKRALMTFGNPFGLALYDKGQENVEHVPTTRREATGNASSSRPTASATPPADSPDTLKAEAKEWERRLRAADSLMKLEQVMDDARDFLHKVPEVTYQHFGKLYETRRQAMETPS